VNRDTTVEAPDSAATATQTEEMPAGPAGSAVPQAAGLPEGTGLASLDLPEIGARAPGLAGRGDPERNIELLKDVSLRVKVELGRGRLALRDVLCLTEGSVVELEKMAGDPLEIYVNDRLVGKGEVLVLNENFCIRVTQIFSPEECLRVRPGGLA